MVLTACTHFVEKPTHFAEMAPKIACDQVISDKFSNLQNNKLKIWKIFGSREKCSFHRQDLTNFWQKNRQVLDTTQNIFGLGYPFSSSHLHLGTIQFFSGVPLKSPPYLHLGTSARSSGVPHPRSALCSPSLGVSPRSRYPLPNRWFLAYTDITKFQVLYMQ